MNDDDRTLIYADGGSKNSGSASQQAYGSFVVDGEQEPHRLVFGVETNNVAEYRAAIAALEYCLEKPVLMPLVRMDSALVVFQVRGEWKVPSNHLFPLWRRLCELRDQTNAVFEKVDGDEVKLFLGH